MAIDATSFRDVMGGFATGVSVVTAADGGRISGITVNSLTSVSLDPLWVLICLTPGRPASDAVERSGRFNVNLLDGAQEGTSRHFADKSLSTDFSAAPFELDEAGVPILEGGVGYLRCRSVRTSDGGDHRIHIGEVIDGEVRSGYPLLYYRGAYRRLET